MLPSEALDTEFDLPDQTQASTSPKEASISHHGLRLGEIGLLLQTEHMVCEVFDDIPVCELPHTPPWFMGMANQRGNIVPVFDLETLLEMQGDDSRRKILILGQREKALGILAERLPERIVLSGQDRIEGNLPIPSLLKRHTSNYYQKDGAIWLQWNIEDFFSEVSDLLS